MTEMFPRGSEWRRWDLHVHTPETKKNDQYTGKNAEEKWEEFYTHISNYVSDGTVSERNIAAIGITDYLSIENYQKILADKRLPNSVKLIIPNVEMRIQPTAKDTPINIHFLFDPSVVPSLDSRFFAKLTFHYGDSDYSARKDELIRLGKNLNPEAAEEEAYVLGIEQFVPTFDSVRKVFQDENLREATIIGVSNNSADGVSGITQLSYYCETMAGVSQLTLARQAIYQFVDFIFSANSNDIKYFCGDGRDDSHTVIKKCGSLKPCLHGSDAHKLSELFEPAQKKYCWIKADPTFNGLRQVLYEPKDRVCISQLTPQMKSPYHVIDSVEIEDSGFIKSPILFSDKLTCIIGGKSNGKSILLHNMAKAIDPKQVAEKTSITHTGTMDLHSVKVHWADGTTDTSLVPEDTHKIVYIPQTYLNRLSDEKEETTEIDAIIQDIVLLNEKAKASYELMKDSIDSYKPKVDKDIYELVQLHSAIKEYKKAESELGILESIKTEIDKLQKQKRKISEEAELSPEEVIQYDQAAAVIRTTKVSLQDLDEFIKNITDTGSVVQKKDFLYTIPSSLSNLVETAIEGAISAADDSWSRSKLEILNTANNIRNDQIATLEINTKIVEKLHPKITESEAIAQLTKEIQEAEVKFKKVEELAKRRKSAEDSFNSVLERLSQAVIEYQHIHSEYLLAVNENADLSTDDLEFSACAPFRSDSFCEFLKKTFDNRTLKAKSHIVDIEHFDIEKFSPGKLKALIVACLNDELPLVRGANPEQAIRGILANWFNITYAVKMDGDRINTMSPGKKALVLLKLLISLADSKSPILIDQPEDDLDNRSIFDELIPFLRKKKVDRQIIVVTHNANVVLGGDAEEIIVANQFGSNTPNKEYRFEYRSGAIENDLPVMDKTGCKLKGILNQQGIQQHICDILEGGERAFELRKHKYHI